MDETGRKVRDAIDAVLRDAGGVDVPQGEHYRRIYEVVLDELEVHLVTAIPELKLAPDVLAEIAHSVALELDWMFSFTPRIFPPRVDA